MVSRTDLTAIFQKHGFAGLGITTPHIPLEDARIFETWLERGDQAGMSWMLREDSLRRRLDPRLLFAPVRSILTVALPYAAPATPGDPTEPRIAAYAHGEDYHLRFPRLLDEAMREVQEAHDAAIHWRCYTDSAPILERSMAVQAGMGWIGRNSCLIMPNAGSWVLLGEVFCDLNLEPDSPFRTDQCGACRRCLEACPTSCIRPDRTIDSRRCISWLTIENRGGIDPELRGKIAPWLFGCDICQIVCPWNRFALPVEPGDLPNLTGLDQWDASRFKQQLRASALSRAKLAGLQRNLALVLAEQARDRAFETLYHLAESADPVVREHAVWALSQRPG